ncbi:hypothetical protein MKD41_02895 [Lutibacter sp. A64]|uniref:hypothetical protein n=1 Tax=Lutibacter sp. A64 TaxID=2918526 RepID=UPI001F0604F1|nr:hypothetical protein [Lutibacter sp. A64]UMB54432.1 hypothetical protein MKD41_02895 [Lutibacter sp. A64]
MKKIALLIFLTAIISCNTEPLKADRFKSGTFEIPAGKGYEKTIIIRQDSLQIEKYEDRVDTLSISWKNNFNYTLKMLHPKTAIDEDPIHVKITNVEDDSYEFEAVIGYSNYVQKGEIFKILE